MRQGIVRDFVLIQAHGASKSKEVNHGRPNDSRKS